MSGVYITLGSRSDQLSPVADYMRFSNESEKRFESSSFSFVWLGHDREDHYAPATDPITGVQVIVAGRLCWSSSQWKNAELFPFEGGLANRVLLDRYLKSGCDSVAPYNGAAMVCIWDPRDQICHLWTDQFGYHPAFVAGRDPSQPTVITTFPDAIQGDPHIQLEPDLVSMAEFLRAWRATPPPVSYTHLTLPTKRIV